MGIHQILFHSRLVSCIVYSLQVCFFFPKKQCDDDDAYCIINIESSRHCVVLAIVLFSFFCSFEVVAMDDGIDIR